MIERDETGDLVACTECGSSLIFDPTYRGTTCGGLELEGGLVCACGMAFITRRARPAERWTLAKGGISVDVGWTRVRAERARGSGGEILALMARIVRLPELERALREVANGAPNAPELARAALGGEEHVDAE